jgi:RNase P subunit RPR2
MTDDKMQQRMEEAYKDYAPAYPPEKNNNRCHNCDMPFVPDQWEVRHINTPNTVGETWIYTCPSCDEETIEIGT